MTDDKVTPLKLVPQIPHNADEDTILGSLRTFLEQTGLLPEYSDEDVEFEPPQGDEIRLGVLTAFEKELFIIATLLGEVWDDLAKSLEADNLEKITAIMRQKGVGFDEALTDFINNSTSSSDDHLTHLRQSVVIRATAGTLFEYNVRRRFGSWHGGLIVRQGFNVYRYG
jgi:hypothetical protein